jgi:N-acetylneuraminate synthase
MEQNLIQSEPFDDLFVLEMANNHWGDLDRGMRIIKDFGQVVRFNNVRAAIKLQFRDPDTFIHKDFRDRDDIRYVKKTMATTLQRDDFAQLTEAVRRAGCIPMATPFDESSVDLCRELKLPMVKLASSDLNDWVLIEKIATLRVPVIASSGGSSLKDIDDLVTFFRNREIPLALNHCVSLYPSEDTELELNQIDFLRRRYPGLTVGFSTHEYHDWTSSMLVAYAKGARTFERHIDIDDGEYDVSPYCSLPDQIDEWFKAFWKVKEMCGAPGVAKRIPPQREVDYLDGLVRGVYARRPLAVGEVLSDDDIYLAVPLLKGQISCRELIAGEELVAPIAADAPVMVQAIGGPYGRNPSLRAQIEARGLEV